MSCKADDRRRMLEGHRLKSIVYRRLSSLLPLPQVNRVGNDPGLSADGLGKLRQINLDAIDSFLRNLEFSSCRATSFLNHAAVSEENNATADRHACYQARCAVEPDFITLNPPVVAAGSEKAEASGVTEQIESDEAMTIAQSRQQTLFGQCFVPGNEHVHPDQAKTSFIGIQFDSQQRLAGRIVQAEPNIGVGVVAGGRRETPAGW